MIRKTAIGATLFVALCSWSCSDDPAPENPDGSTDGGDGVGGSATGGTGGRSSGGVAGRASGGTAVTGGASSAGGDAGLPEAGQGGAPSNDGGDAATDGGDAATDGGDAATDGDAPEGGAHEPPCPLGPNFPVGKYRLNTLTAASREDQSALFDPATCVETLQTGTATLEIRYHPGETTMFDLELRFDGTWPGFLGGDHPFRFVGVIDLPDVWAFELWCAPGASCSGVETQFRIEIDKRTGVITKFVLKNSHSMSQIFSTDMRATGWPQCAATDASPPAWVPAPSGPLSVVGCSAPVPIVLPKPELGCTVESAFGGGPPRCATRIGPCSPADLVSCTDYGTGYVEVCCPD